jgi:aspartate/methionine/tyrosine aminotransferase
MAVLASLLGPGDELICPRPCYPAYVAMAHRLGARTIAVDEAGGSFAGWPHAVADRLGPRTRAVVLSSPSNPTGATLTDDEARELYDICRHHGIRLICDEAYAEYRFATRSKTEPAVFDPERRTVVQIRSASKTWSVCGWRIGWVVADPQMIRSVARQHLALIGPASGPAQAALEQVNDVGPGHLQQARREVRRRSDELLQTLARHGVNCRPPQGGFYLWLDVHSLVGDDRADATTSWCELLARKTGVGLWPGDDFGGPGHVRIAVTAPAPDAWGDAVQALDRAFEWARRQGSR